MAMNETDTQQNILFPRLSDTEIATLERIGTKRHLRDGEVLLDIGEPTGEFFVVLSGAVEIMDRSGGPDEEPRTITVHQPGQFTGSISLLKHWRSIARGVARGDTEVLDIPSADLRRIIVERPALGETILKAFIARWDALRESGLRGPRVVGSEHSRQAFLIREFLARNQVPFTWIGIEAEPSAAELLQRFGLAEEDMPAVVCAERPLMRNPSIRELAEAIGLKRPLGQQGNGGSGGNGVYDLVVVGAGPAGLAAAVYGSSEGLSTLVLDSWGPGGQAGASMKIENYLGFPTGVTGADLMSRALIQAQKFGAEFSTPSPATGLDVVGTGGRDHFSQFPAVLIEGGERVGARCVLIATGAHYNRLEVPGCEQFEGLGVYYAATPTEMPSWRGAEVVVVGGGNSAGQAIVFLASHVRRVWVLLRGGDLGKSMSSYLVERIGALDNVEVLYRTKIRQMLGDAMLEAVEIENGRTGERRTISTPAVFSFIGAVPRTDWLPAAIETDDKGFVRTGRAVTDSSHWTLDREPFMLETSHPGVFAAGDVRSGSVKRCAASVGEGSMAVAFIHQYLSLSGTASTAAVLTSGRSKDST
jgi:thioredoxin reductase (NADPH)